MKIAAQEKKTLSLNEAIDLSIQNSKQLKNSQAKIEEATAALKEAVEKRTTGCLKFPVSYLRLNSANFESLRQKVIIMAESTNSGTAPDISQAIYGLLNVSLPVYSGGRIRYGIESSRFLEQAAKLDAEDDKDEVIQNAIEAFANLFKAKTAVKIGLIRKLTTISGGGQKILSNLEKKMDCWLVMIY